MNITTIVLIVVGIILVWLAAMYNGLVRVRNRVREAWSDIDVQLKRRYDLIPNLINTVKGYAKHEDKVFEKVTQARAAAISAGSVEERGKAEIGLAGALKSLFAVAEAYPDLKASENFKQLQLELTDTEDKIQAARRFYNGNVLSLNTKIEQFPTNIFAKAFGFMKEKFFELDDAAERAVPKVEF